MSGRSGKVKDADELLKELDHFLPTDQEFESQFSSRRVTTSKLARYYLHSLERVADETPDPELIPNQDVDSVNLEHILPKNPDFEEWPNLLPDEVSLWTHRLGNMTLLAKGPNSRIGNKPWTIKQPVLEQSKIQLAQRAAEKIHGTKSEIENAQQYMATLALTAWPRSPR